MDLLLAAEESDSCQFAVFLGGNAGKTCWFGFRAVCRPFFWGGKDDFKYKLCLYECSEGSEQKQLHKQNDCGSNSLQRCIVTEM